MENLTLSAATRLGSQTVRTTRSGEMHAFEALRVLGLEQPEAGWPELYKQLNLPDTRHDFGEGAVPVISSAAFSALAFALHTPQARRWQARAQKLLGAYLAGDVQTAAEIAERCPSPERRAWLSARLESTEARKRFMANVAKAGGNGPIFRQVSSLSNRSVLNTDSASFRRERGVRDTRDGMTAQELLRLSYLETASASALQATGAQGNEQILKVHSRTADSERQVWQSAHSSAS